MELTGIQLSTQKTVAVVIVTFTFVIVNQL